MSGSIERIKLKAKAAEGGNNQVNDNEFLDTSIKIETTNTDCSDDEINLLICLNGRSQIVIVEGEGENKRELQCKTVKLVEINNDEEEVCSEYKWDKKNRKYSAPNPENKIPYTPVTVNNDKVELTPSGNQRKRKRESLADLRKKLNASPISKGEDETKTRTNGSGKQKKEIKKKKKKTSRKSGKS